MSQVTNCRIQVKDMLLQSHEVIIFCNFKYVEVHVRVSMIILFNIIKIKATKPK